MHIPYSMDDLETDLHGGLGGHQPNDDEWYFEWIEKLQEKYWVSKNARMDYIECPKFYTQTDIDKLIQKHLQAIDLMREEIMESYTAGYDSGYTVGYSNGLVHY